MNKFKLFQKLLLASVFVFGVVVLSCTKEGAVAISASSKAANPNVNWKNYKEVKQVLNLKD